jgi:hypothetical protein
MDRVAARLLCVFRYVRMPTAAAERWSTHVCFHAQRKSAGSTIHLVANGHSQPILASRKSAGAKTVPQAKGYAWSCTYASDLSDRSVPLSDPFARPRKSLPRSRPTGEPASPISGVEPVDQQARNASTGWSLCQSRQNLFKANLSSRDHTPFAF